MQGNVKTASKQTGFTIVELLIVVVVIAILAAITIVAFNGITDRARISSLQTSLAQASRKIQIHQTENSALPATLATVGISSDSTITYTYRNYGTQYCLAVATGSLTFETVNAESTTVGDCVRLTAATYVGQATSSLEYSGEPIVRGTLARPMQYSWGGGTPLAGGPNDNFVTVITGFLTPPVSGTYTFTTAADDRDLLYINDQLVVDGSLTASNTTTSGTIDLTANSPVRFRVVYRENTGNAGYNLSWSYPGQATSYVPNAAFNTQP